MQERSRGSKRFELGDVSPSDALRGVEQSTRASIYQEDHTPAHWPPPTDANTRGMQGKPRAPRNGLIASQLGLPMQTRMPAQPQHFPPDSWQTQAAADGDWPLDDYAASGQQPAAAYPEYATFGEDAELQAALDIDNSQGLYDEQLGAYYSAATPPIDLRLPPVAAPLGLAWSDEEVVTSHYSRPGHHHVAPQPAATGKYPFADVARQSAQPTAARWQAQQPIQRVAPASAGRAAAQPNSAGHNAAPNPYANAPTPRANGRVANAGGPRGSAGAKPNATNAPRQLARPTNTQARNANTQAHNANTQRNAPAQARNANTQARNANTQARNANTQPRNANTQPRNANTQPRNANTQPRNANTQARNANTQAHPVPTQLNRTANAQLNRTAPTQHNVPAHLNRTANAQHSVPAHLNRTAPHNAPAHTAPALDRTAPAQHNATAHLNRTASAHNAPARSAPVHLNRTAAAQHNVPVHLNRSANTQARSASWQSGPAAAQSNFGAALRPAARSFIVDDEPISYPKPRSSGWLKTFVFLLCVGGGAYVARDQIAPSFLTTPAPRPQPTPVAAPTPAISEPIPEPAAPAPVPAPEAVATPAAEPSAPQDDAKARRSAARAAIIAERWRERRAARHAQGEYADDSEDTPPNEPTQSTHYTAKAAPQPGVLRINSRPWSNIFVDGQPVGHTPQMNLQLPAGQHQITLINNEMQLRKAINVTIMPGETVTQTVNLAE